jgi:hypothetical protein
MKPRHLTCPPCLPPYSVPALLGTLAVAFVAFCAHPEGQERLDRVVADLDRREPGWRWEQLVAARPPIPAAENAAPLVLKAAALVPKNWQTWRPEPEPKEGEAPPRHYFTIQEEINDLPPPQALNARQMRDLKDDLSRVEDAVRAARTFATARRGRFAKENPRRALSQGLPYTHIIEAGRLRDPLYQDALRRAYEHDIAGAIVSCQALLGINRAIGDELEIIAPLYRAGLLDYAAMTLERILAQGETTAAALAILQRQVENERDEPILRIAFRGERAALAVALRAESRHKQAALIDQSLLMEDRPYYRNEVGPVPGTLAGLPVWLRYICHALCYGWWLEGAADHLESIGELIALQDRPAAERHQRLKQLLVVTERLSRTGFPTIYRDLHWRMMRRAFIRMAESDVHKHAVANYLMTALAAERYRLVRGRWPETLDQLVPDFMTAVPTDPYSGGPLRYRRLADGVIIYSVGRDETDDAGRLARDQGWDTRKTDIGFRLWDVPHRRQPPR